MMIETVQKKLGFDPQLHSTARTTLLKSFHSLNDYLDKKIVIPIVVKEEEPPRSLEYKAEQWVEIKNITDSIVNHIRNIVGYTKALAFPGTAMSGADIIVSYLLSGTIITTTPIAYDRKVTIIRGVLEIPEGSVELLKRITVEGSRKFFSNNYFYIKAGEKAEYRVIHNVIVITKLITDPTEDSPL